MPDHDPLRVAYIGNFRPPHSTENLIRAALTGLGHRVIPLQENDPDDWAALRGHLLPGGIEPPDLILWTRTWHLPHIDQAGMLRLAADAGVPTVAYHLDRWWGLDREHQIDTEPFFRCSLVVTAEGNRPWADRGINHLWMPPAVLDAETRRTPTWKARWNVPIVFVGSHPYPHPEWKWRSTMLAALGARYGRRFRIFPNVRHPLVRGQDLTDLYATAQVVVGDSCLAGGATHYWSDRVPETLGRGGILVHPDVDGMGEWGLGPMAGAPPITYGGEGDLSGLYRAVDMILDLSDDERADLRWEAQDTIRAGHTFEDRMTSLLAHLGLRPTGVAA